MGKIKNKAVETYGRTIKIDLKRGKYIIVYSMIKTGTIPIVQPPE